MIFGISDLHLSLGTDKPMDIFRGWENYVERLTKNWNNTVGPTDTVVINGDISWSLKLASALADFRFIDRLPGNKLLIKGNHDLWWSTAKKMNDFLKDNELSTIKILFNNAYKIENTVISGSRGWFFDDGGDKKVLNREVGRLKMSIAEGKKLGDVPLVFLHYPPIYKGAVCQEIMETLIDEGIKECCYGHIHLSGRGAAFEGEYSGIKFKLLSCDGLDFTPQLLRR